jgi:hypothetical protein
MVISTKFLRRRIVIADFVFSSLWASFWFINFCYITNSWNKTQDMIKEKADSDKVQTTIAFSFFSTLLWVIFLITVCFPPYLNMQTIF